MSQKPPAYHKLVQTTADGRKVSERLPNSPRDIFDPLVLKTLFIAAHAEYVVGRPKEEGLRLINALIEHCTQPKYVLPMKWQGPGDLVIWGKVFLHLGESAY